MSLADELEKLNALHERGALTAEEFIQAKKRLLEGSPEDVKPASDATQESALTLGRLHRSINDRWIGGVCGGLGELSGIPAWAWRILFVLTAALHGLGVLMYVLLWVFVPTEKVAAQPVVVPKE